MISKLNSTVNSIETFRYELAIIKHEATPQMQSFFEHLARSGKASNETN